MLLGRKSDPHDAWVRQAIERFEGPLVRYATRIVRDHETAREVVQDTFTKLCGADAAALNGRLAPWLYTVCRNRAFDVAQKARRSAPLGEEAARRVPSAAPSPREAAQGSEANALLLQALGHLDPPQQEVFRLRFHEEFSYAEISEITGHTTNHVRYLIHTALKHLRDALREHLDLAGLAVKD